MAPPGEVTDDDWASALAEAKADTTAPAAAAGGEADAMAAEWGAMLGGGDPTAD